MTLRRVATVLALLAVLPAFAAAQGLGDAAAREKAKRQAGKKAEAKVFTNDDLAQGRPPGTSAQEGAGSSSTSSPPAGASPEAGASEASPEGRTDEQAHLDAVNAARARVAEIESRIKELQAKLNPMSTTFIYGDFNVGGDKVAEEAAVKAELAQAEAQRGDARQAVAQASQAAQESFRQGRSAGRPTAQ